MGVLTRQKNEKIKRMIHINVIKNNKGIFHIYV